MCWHCCSEREEFDAILEAKNSLKANPALGCIALYGCSRQIGMSGCKLEVTGCCFTAQEM